MNFSLLGGVIVIGLVAICLLVFGAKAMTKRQ